MSIHTFTPKNLPNIPVKWGKIIELIGKAHEAIGHYDEMLQGIQNPEILFSILNTQEAVLSLEFQQKKRLRAVLEDVLIFDACGKTQHQKKAAVADVVSYRSALDAAKSAITHGPLSLSLIKKIHTLVKKNSGTSKKDIGVFRNRQNWIGPIGCTIEEAYFYPPPAHLVKNAMANLEKYISYPEKNVLVQLAIIFVQFLIIHPFMDGNGRISRMLIPLFLAKKKITSKPVFYISRYFQKNRLKYMQNLFNTSMKNDWEGWIRFFLAGIVQESACHLKKAKKIHSLYQSLDRGLSGSIPPKSIKRVLDTLFMHPVFTLEQFVHRSGLPIAKAKKTLKILEAKKMTKFFYSPFLEHQQLIQFIKLIELVKKR
jgi:Fic family protein